MLTINANKKLEEILGLDLRSLAFFRITLALLIITNLWERSQALTAHYTDFGVLPRGFLGQGLLSPWAWSLHFFSGQPIFQALLFLLAVLAAVALLIGFHTQWATIISWILELSVINRNWLLNTGGDKELCLLLFWSIFLPLGAYYSVDRALNSSNKSIPKTILSGATIAYTLQICLIYWFAWALKSGASWRQDGTAVYYALSLDYMATPFGHFLLNFPSLLVFFTFTTLAIELLGPFLLFIPFATSFFRGFAVVLFILLHTGFGLSLKLGVFAFVSAIAWLAFIPSDFWDKISQYLPIAEQNKIHIYYDQDSDSALKFIRLLQTFLLLKNLSIIPAQENPEILIILRKRNYHWLVINTNHNQGLIFKTLQFSRKIYHLLAQTTLIASLQFRPLIIRTSLIKNLFTLYLLGCVLLWNLNTLNPTLFGLPQYIIIINRSLGLDQYWGTFAASPSVDDGWYVIPGKLKDGTEVDLFRDGKPVSWEKPKLVSELYPTMYWLKYMEQLVSRKNPQYRPYYAQYLCRSWNSQHQGLKQLDNLEINYMLEKTLPDYQNPKIEKLFLLKHQC